MRSGPAESFHFPFMTLLFSSNFHCMLRRAVDKIPADTKSAETNKMYIFHGIWRETGLDLVVRWPLDQLKSRSRFFSSWDICATCVRHIAAHNSSFQAFYNTKADILQSFQHNQLTANPSIVHFRSLLMWRRPTTISPSNHTGYCVGYVNFRTVTLCWFEIK